ncbi:MAG: DUF4159 domain-containing protein [Desulfobacterales bacterium]|nr:MAG: DUF4159 domain-containing protein [Desulfobacterales bacterium]
MISRRQFIQFIATALGLAGGCILPRTETAWGARYPHFYFTQLKYRGGEWDPNPLFAAAMVEEIELRTSIDVRKERRVMELSDPDLFFCPFLYMAGRYAFESFTPSERQILNRFLTYGGFLFAEDTAGAEGFGFDRSFRSEMREILPNNALERLSPDHSVYQSFYLINRIGGRREVKPFLEGISLGPWTPVIYSQNDLSGAWARDRYGQWVHDCAPGGDIQRQDAFKTGINMVVYSLTADYKKDVIHHPFIRRRRNL